MFKKKRPSALMKKPIEIEPIASTSELDSSEVIIASKKPTMNHLIQGSGLSSSKRKRQAEQELIISDDDEFESSTFEIRHSASTKRERRRSSSPPAEISAESIKAAAEFKLNGGILEAVKDDGLYHGKVGLAHKLPKAFGPIKGGPGNVRTITIVDYQPDVCKDYKETGFCGFGDTCKFLHDRGDYLHGWQLDNSFLSSNAAAGSFLAKQAARTAGEEQEGEEIDPEQEDLPFACLICRKTFGKEPIVTLCGHYFDSSCAIKRFAKTSKCFACGKGTNGVFNKGKKLIAQIAERERVAAAAALEGQEDSDGGNEFEFEGLETRESEVVQQEEEGSEGEYEEEVQVVKRRPIIELV